MQVFDWRFLRFLAVGVGNTVVGLGVIFAAKQIANDVTANFIGYLLMVPLTFFTHRNLTFQDQDRRLPAFGRYIISIILGYIGNRLVLSWALTSELNAYISQVLAIAAHVVVVYVLSVLFVFTSYKTESV